MTTSPPRQWRHIVAAGIAALIVSGALAACSSSGGGTTATDNAAPAPAEKGAEPAAGGAVPGAAVDPKQDGGTNQQAPAQIEPQQRSLIYNGTISVKVDNVTVAADQAIDVANGFGGAVGGDKRTLDADRSEAQLVLRVPSEKFSAALAKLGKLGTEQARSVDTQDVTEAMVDLDARLETQRASVDRIRALLAKAQTIGEISSVESELSRRQADLDSLVQRKAKLAGLVALSTITVELRGPAAPEPASAQPDNPGFVAGLKSGWSAFVKSIRVLLVVGGWLLPWIVAIGVPVWLVLWLLRRRNRPTRTTPTLSPPPSPADPS